MANPEHMRILQKGVVNWNQWRVENPTVQPDLSEAVLAERDLNDANFCGARIHGVDFSKAKLLRCNFRNVKAGLHRKRRTRLIATYFGWSAVAGFSSGFIGYIVASPLDPRILSNILTFLPSTPLAQPKWAAVASITVIISAILFFIKTVEKGLWPAFRLLAIIFLIVTAFTFLGSISEDFASAGIVAFAIALVGIMSLAYIILFTCLGVLSNFRTAAVAAAWTIAVSTAAAVVAAGKGTSYSTILVASVTDVIFISTNSLIAWKAFNGDSKYALVKKLCIVLISAKGTSFRKADLTEADFHNSDLRNTDFSLAILSRASFHGSMNLRLARVDGTILEDDFAQELLCTHRASKRDYSGISLKEANLSGAENIRGIKLVEADISNATFEHASLENSDLTSALAIGTNFSHSILTGACLSNLNFDDKTRFRNVKCDYIYLEPNFQGKRPRDGMFKTGEFEALFRKVVDTVDLVFTDGIDWQAFFKSFQELRRQYPDQGLSIQAIEKKRQGSFVVRLEVPASIDRAAIEKRAKELYSETLIQIENRYKEQFRVQNVSLEEANRRIEDEKKEKSELRVIMEIMANNQGPKYSFHDSTIGNIIDNAQTGSQIQSVLHNYAPKQSQDLVAAAAEIQEILDQLATSYPPVEIPGQAVTQIQQNPELKDRVIGAIKSGGKTALEKLVNHPAICIVLSAIEGASNPG